MNLLDLVTGPWAIVPDKLLEIQAIYATHLRGEKIDVAGIEARLGRPLSNEQRAYEVRAGGVAVLPVMGVMAPRANMLMQVSGGISTQMATRQVSAMRADPAVRSVVLQWDSPGGNVFGLPALGDEIRALAAEKPTVSVVEGSMASGAYWTGCAANAIFVEGATDMVGSIGVYSRLSWDPKSDTSVELVAGKFKRAAINGQPSPEAIAEAQARVDHLYQVFVQTVAANRGVTAEQVIERMAEGRVFVGQQAIDAGLVDGASTVEAMVERLATNPQEFAQRRKAVFALGGPPAQEDEPVLPVAASTPTSEGNTMTQQVTVTRESLERDHAALFAQIRSEGAEAERARIAQVRAQLVPGHEALIDKLAADGKSTGGDAAMAILAAQKAEAEAARKAHEEDAPAPAKAAHAPEDKPAAKSKEQQVAEAQRFAAEKGVDIVSAMKQLGFVH